jgi:alpha-L-fucosidase
MPNGQIQPEFTERLAAIGDWLKVYGETVYGTKGGFVTPQEWGAVTEKKNVIYIHILKWPGDKMMLEIPYTVKSARLFQNKSPIKYQNLGNNYVVFDLKGVQANEIDTVIEVEVMR